MKIGDKLRSISPVVDDCTIEFAPKPPEKWTVIYTTGRVKRWSKSHLKKYYYVLEEYKDNV